MAITETTWDRAVQLLSDAGQVALACHIDPDGDAIGSLLALQRFLEKQGVRVPASFGFAGTSPGGIAGTSPGGIAGTSPGGIAREGADPSMVVPPQYTFLPGLEGLVPPTEFPTAPEVFVGLDTGSPGRLGTLRQSAEAAGAVILIDHHASGSAFGDVRLVDPAAAATAVIVEELIRRMGGELDREMATCLYVGLVTDTARFQHPTTTPQVMELAARLMSKGIDHAAISRQVWETHSFGYLKVLGRALDRATLVPEVGLAWTVIFHEDLDELGITMAETEGLIDVLRAVEAADVTLVCKERPDGSWKASLRSKGRIDAGRVAIALGGGGHAFAAGFVAEGSLSEVVARVVDVVQEEEARSTAGSGSR